LCFLVGVSRAHLENRTDTFSAPERRAIQRLSGRPEKKASAGKLTVSRRSGERMNGTLDEAFSSPLQLEHATVTGCPETILRRRPVKRCRRAESELGIGKPQAAARKVVEDLQLARPEVKRKERTAAAIDTRIPSAETGGGIERSRTIRNERVWKRSIVGPFEVVEDGFRVPARPTASA
jgi:hypothetical protein